MRADKFTNLVADMRSAQKRYFRERTQSALRAARELESKVDLILKEKLGDPIQTKLEL